MSNLIDFVLAVVIISASGVMAPGPLFATNMTYGIKEGTNAGIKLATGHAIVELPLVVILGTGAFSWEVIPEFRILISILGAVVLFIFATIQIRSIIQKKESKILHQRHGIIITGVTLSALNPFLIVWWLSVGLKLISDAVIIWAMPGIMILFVLHIWMDFAWLGMTAFFAKKSSKIISNKIYRIVMISLSLSLIYYGIVFLNDFLTTV